MMMNATTLNDPQAIELQRQLADALVRGDKAAAQSMQLLLIVRHGIQLDDALKAEIAKLN